ncbi:MAG: hypothetical protein ABEJ70_05005 [Halobacteriaceae archaeon]
MSNRTSASASERRPLISSPDSGLAYVAIVAALVSAVIHLSLAPRVMGFNQTTGTLFYLNGVGWLGGVVLYLSRYWRRPLYLVAAAYALVTIVAFLAMSGRPNALSVVAKVAEAVVVLVTGYLYVAAAES